VDFESLLEREYLLAADNAPDIVAIAAQPLALLWPRATQRNRDHVPDFFVRLASGVGRLIDVRSPKAAEKHAEQSTLTRKVCDEIGWEYEVFTGLPRELAHNLRWLAGCRQDRNARCRKHEREAGHHRSSTKRSAWSMACIRSGPIIPWRDDSRSTETTRS